MQKFLIKTEANWR